MACRVVSTPALLHIAGVLRSKYCCWSVKSVNTYILILTLACCFDIIQGQVIYIVSTIHTNHQPLFCFLFLITYPPISDSQLSPVYPTTCLQVVYLAQGKRHLTSPARFCPLLLSLSIVLSPMQCTNLTSALR
ncbi:hypothetical protein GGS20DRAFT_41872 [Poronia punctata]|nr:hypothetical protein GGS20DRAFT_41872 [Poronia punctata]